MTESFKIQRWPTPSVRAARIARTARATRLQRARDNARGEAQPDGGQRPLEHYIASALAQSTRRAYASDLQHFRQWGGRIPARPAMIARYLAAHAGKVKVSTLNRRLAAIASAHAALRVASPTRDPLVLTALRGIRRVHGAAQRQAKPVTLELLRKLAKPQPHLDPVRDLRDRTLLVVGFAGGFRRSELARMRLGDLRLREQGIEVTLSRSKTDQESRGRIVALPRGRGALCPVKLLKQWLRLLGKCDPGAKSEQVFRRVDRYGRLGSGLSGAAVGAVMRRRMTELGIDPEGYSAHSLRSGLVTAAAKAGAPTWAIQRQTGHRSERSVHRYIRGISLFERNAFKSIAN